MLFEDVIESIYDETPSLIESLSLVKILLGEGPVNYKYFKYLFLKELGFIHDGVNNLSEYELQSVYRFTLSQLLSAEVTQAYSEEQLKKSPKASKAFLDTLSQYWFEAININVDKANEENLSRIPFQLSSAAMDGFFQQLQKDDYSSIIADTEPTAQWLIRGAAQWQVFGSDKEYIL